jgi:flavin-dependent dehydrogenase
MKTIAIIGGGPAGAVAARGLLAPDRDRSNRVIVFEERCGWEKPCGGGLPYKALRQYPFLLQATDPHVCIRDLELVAANGDAVQFHLNEPLAIYSRSTLNHLLLRRAEDAGAEIVQDRVLNFSRTKSGWRITGRQGNYAADFLILAAGARSRLRGLLAPHFSSTDFMLTFGYYAPRSDSLTRVQFFDDFEGYAWSFPRTDHVSIGICGKAGKTKTSDLRELLRTFMDRFGYADRFDGAEKPAVFSHLLPALSAESWHNLKLGGPGWALAGDAAGVVDPVTGEGIYFAMRSGDILAESLLDGAPESYPERVWHDFGQKLAVGARLSHLFYEADFLGQPSTTRLIQFAARSAVFRRLVQELIDGSQSYSGLASRLYTTFGTALGEIVIAGIRSQLNLVPVDPRLTRSGDVWPRSQNERTNQEPGVASS